MLQEHRAIFTIRPTSPADVSALPPIERSAGTAFLAVPDLAWIAADAVTPETRHLDLIRNGAAWVAVEASDEPAGFLAAETIAGNLHLWQVAVRRDLQGRGIGRALIEAAARFAGANAMPMLTLTTFRGVPWNEPFYRRCGFRTLAPAEQSDALRRILADEAKSGLPPARRCAMARPLP